MTLVLLEPVSRQALKGATKEGAWGCDVLIAHALFDLDSPTIVLPHDRTSLHSTQRVCSSNNTLSLSHVSGAEPLDPCTGPLIC